MLGLGHSMTIIHYCDSWSINIQIDFCGQESKFYANIEAKDLYSLKDCPNLLFSISSTLRWICTHTVQ